MAIELYVFPPSPRAFKVMVTANHLGINPALHFLDLRKGEQKAAGYATLNPNQRMPTLRDGDDVIWESEAILQYLASKTPSEDCFPPASVRGSPSPSGSSGISPTGIPLAPCSPSNMWPSGSCAAVPSRT